MPFIPANVDVYTAAYTGALAGITSTLGAASPHASAANYAFFAVYAGGYAEVVDMLWDTTSTTQLDLDAIQGMSMESWAALAPLSSTAADPYAWAAMATAMLKVVAASDTYYTGEGITPPGVPPTNAFVIATANAAKNAAIAAAAVTSATDATAAANAAYAAAVATASGDATTKANAAQAAAIAASDPVGAAAAAQAAAIAASDPVGAAAAAQAAAIAASQPLDADLTAIAALATTAYGRSLLTIANQAGLQLASQVGWQTIADIDLTVQPTQSLAVNGTYTIGGVAGWQRQNSAKDRVAMALTNGVGLTMQPGIAASGYDAATVRTAPLLWLPLSALGIPNLDWSTRLRIWIQAQDSYATGGVFNAGDNFFFGLDSNSDAWVPWVVQIAPVAAVTTRRFTALAGISNTAKFSTAVDQTVAATVNNIVRLDTAEFGNPNSLGIWWDKSSANWPAVGAASLRPVNILTSNYASTVGTAYPVSVNPGSNVALADSIGLVIGCSQGAANDKYELLVKRIRIDYKL